MDVLLGWLWNILELTIFKRNITGLFPYPDNQIKKEKKGETKTHTKKVFQVLLGQRHLAEDHTQTIYRYW